MKTLIALLITAALTGCVMKKTIIKELQPVDQTMILLSQFDCTVFASDVSTAIKCEQMKIAATSAHNSLMELGVKPQK